MRLNITPVVSNLLIVNLLVLIIDQIIPFDLNSILGLSYIESDKFRLFQFFTYMFAHSGWGHLFGNMIGLIIFGALLEQVWGAKRFLFFYIFTGVGAGLIHMGINYWEIYQLKEAVYNYLAAPSDEAFYVFVVDHVRHLQPVLETFIEEFQKNPNDPGLIAESIKGVNSILDAYIQSSRMVGASGAVMGLVAGLALLFPNTELYLYFIPFPIKAKYPALAYIAFDVYGVIKDSPNDNIAHFAHLGGMIFAFILVEYWKRRRDTFY